MTASGTDGCVWSTPSLLNRLSLSVSPLLPVYCPFRNRAVSSHGGPMLTRWSGFAACAAGALLTTVCCADASPEVKAAVEKSMKAMGADNVKSIVISGEGWDGCVGQQYNPNSPNWRKFSNKNYVRSIDLDARGWRLQRVRGEGENPGRGGCHAGPIAEQTPNKVTNAGHHS